MGLDIPNVCGPCEDAPCVEICPVYAMQRDPVSGMVTVDYSRCILCKSCVGTCPNGVIILDTERMRIVKCDHCDGDPECVKVCPTGAITYTTPGQAAIKKRYDSLHEYLSEIARVSL